jgi:hypothetical protein
MPIPHFAAKLEAILSPLPDIAPGKSKTKTVSAPDVYAEFDAKGSDEFAFWLRTLDFATLKAIVKTNGFDPGKTTSKPFPQL